MRTNKKKLQKINGTLPETKDAYERGDSRKTKLMTFAQLDRLCSHKGNNLITMEPVEDYNGDIKTDKERHFGNMKSYYEQLPNRSPPQDVQLTKYA